MSLQTSERGCPKTTNRAAISPSGFDVDTSIDTTAKLVSRKSLIALYCVLWLGQSLPLRQMISNDAPCGAFLYSTHLNARHKENG